VVPDLPVQFIHEDDLGRAILQCVAGAGPAGVYNVAADDVLSLVDVARELGAVPLRIPGGPVAAAARLVARLPLMPSSFRWLEALSHPAIMDTSRAKTELGWTPRHTALEAVRDTFR
jgi:nucleoside-diphosphate-sugar epimerase